MPNAKPQATVTAPSPESPRLANVQNHINLIVSTDALLGRAAKSLIELTAKCQPPTDAHRDTSSGALYFPPWVPSTSTAPTEKFLLTRALCCQSLQRLWFNRRRFQWLKPDDAKELEKWQKSHFADTFIPTAATTTPPSLEDYASCLSSSTFDGVNPFTASQVFRVLIYGGENKAHRGIGFLAFFVMVWSLRRRFPEGNIRGASLEPSQPTAYLTTKCLFPIKLIADICRRRAKLYDDMEELVTKLEKVVVEESKRNEAGVWSPILDRWKFASTLSELSINLADVSEIAIDRDAFRECSNSIEGRADKLDSYTPSADVWRDVKSDLVKALQAVAKESRKVWKEADQVVTQIEEQIVKNLKPEGISELKRCKINIGAGRESDKEDDKRYWADHNNAAGEALEICKKAVDYLKKASEIESTAELEEPDGLKESLRSIVAANKSLSSEFNKIGIDSARWCRSVVEREIAHASAGDATDFDAAELISGIATAVHWRQMTSPLEIADAIHKAVEEGARPDGSWRAGQPVYTHGRLLGAYPITSDIVWLLAGVIKQYPEVHVADEAIERYVSWLERRVSEATVEATIKGAKEQVRVIGWASERSRERNRVDLWATAFSVNALLEIRDLAEERIWQVCKRRFSIISPTKSLPEVDPVDLGARHRDRLHTHLSKMARKVQMGEPDAKYAFMLHGPPGSSKTAMAQAAAKEMWRGPSASLSRPTRLIRITPADFTRFGEDRLDSEAQAIFTLLMHVRGAVILFDEVDDLLRKRTTEKPSFMELIIPAMLNRLADLRESCPRQEVCYIFATNFIQNIEAALIRRGRLDAPIPVVYPDTESRFALIERRVEKLRVEAKESVEKGLESLARSKENIAKQLEDLESTIVGDTRFWPWMTIQDFLDELCEHKSASDAEVIELGKRYKSIKRDKLELKTSPYAVEALFKKPPSRQLLDEFLHYSFSGWSTWQKYKQRFEADLAEWKSEPSKGVLSPADKDQVFEIRDLGAELWLREGRLVEEEGVPFPTKREEPELQKAA